ncbi:MAG: hypothetical protein KAS32_17905 [Candidatus Peribacteraceae bacterium]|nr:hypothetical protein [Candidatus Peribacteraceae bacterium]
MKIFQTDKQQIKVLNFIEKRNIEGYVLDIGRGGEGIIRHSYVISFKRTAQRKYHF